MAVTQPVAVTQCYQVSPAGTKRSAGDSCSTAGLVVKKRQYHYNYMGFRQTSWILSLTVCESGKEGGVFFFIEV